MALAFADSEGLKVLTRGGEVVSSDEHLVIAKSHRGRFDRICERVGEIHPYETPEIIAVALILAGGSGTRLYPITLGLSNWNSQTQRLPEFYELTTGGVLLSIIPLLVAMIVLQRFWRGGMTAGAVKE